MYLNSGDLRAVHHIAINVADMDASVHFYGRVLGLHRLTGTEIPSSIVELVNAGKVTNFRTPDGIIIDLFAEPELPPPDPDPERQFTRVNHLAFDIDPTQFDRVLAVLAANQIPLAGEPVTRSTGRGVYCYDPDGFIVEIRCDPLSSKDGSRL
jgi:glyoxylase I family protein